MTDTLIHNKLENFFSKSRAVFYSKGEIITIAGHDPTGVSLILDGIVEQYDITPEGNKITVNLFKPHAFFPMSWAVNKTPNIYFYAALTDVTIKQASPSDVVSFLEKNPDVLLDLLRRVYKGADGLLRRLVLTSSGTATNRLVFELLVLSYRFGTSKDKRIINIKHGDIAAQSGLSRETVSRILHKLDNEKLIMLTKEGIVIDIDRLEEKLN